MPDHPWRGYGLVGKQPAGAGAPHIADMPLPGTCAFGGDADRDGAGNESAHSRDLRRAGRPETGAGGPARNRRDRWRQNHWLARVRRGWDDQHDTKTSGAHHATIVRFLRNRQVEMVCGYPYPPEHYPPVVTHRPPPRPRTHALPDPAHRRTGQNRPRAAPRTDQRHPRTRMRLPIPCIAHRIAQTYADSGRQRIQVDSRGDAEP